jgi:hypothetical protein
LGSGDDGDDDDDDDDQGDDDNRDDGPAAGFINARNPSIEIASC